MIGDAPGDAARMRSLAEAGQVVVTATTRQVGGQLFTYHAFQPVTANGVPHPATAWRVMGPRPVASRSEALYRGKPAPLIGRVEEQTFLPHAWQQVKSGEVGPYFLQVNQASAKTRLLKELEAWLATDKHASLRYFCSPLHQGTALHPIIAHWEQEAGFARGDTSEQRLSKLEALRSRRVLACRGCAGCRHARDRDGRALCAARPQSTATQGTDLCGAAAPPGEDCPASAGADAVRRRSLGRP